MKHGRMLALILCLAMAMAIPAMAEQEAYFDGRDFSEHLSISFASIQIKEGQNYYDSDEWCKWWGDTFNIDFEITPIDDSNWAENLRIWISSGDMPDWAAWNYNHGDLVNYVDQGLVKELPADWKERYPNLAASQEYVQLAAIDDELFGGTYTILRPVFSLNFPAEKVSDHYSVYLRRDWAAQVGYELENCSLLSLTQLLDLAAKMKAEDPGNVGENFYPIEANASQIAWLINYVNPYCGRTGAQGPYYLGSDGQYHWGPADETTGTALKQIKDALDAGLIDPEFYTLGSYDGDAMFYSLGTAGICLYQGMAYRMDEMEVSMSQDLGLDYDEVAAAVIITDEEGNFHAQSIANYYGANLFSPDITDAKLERLLTMMDYSVTEKGQEKIHYGIEGKDYEVNEDGTITVLRTAEDGELWDEYAMLPTYVNMVALSDDFQFENPAFTQYHRDVCKRLYETRCEHSTEETFPSTIDFNVVLHTSQAKNLASMNYTDEYSVLLTMEGDITTNWQNWVNEKMPLIQPVLDELNANLNK